MKPNHALILTAFSYKGGNGRTMCVANVARYLAARRGFRVGVIDLDTEAPGLVHYDFGARENLNRGKVTLGVLDLFSKTEENAQAYDRAEFVRKHIADHIAVASPAGEAVAGSLFLMPAINEDHSSSPQHFEVASRFNEFLREDIGGKEPPFLHCVAKAFIELCQLDYLLIDARTGLGASFPTVFMGLSQALLLFMGLNEQNLDGSLAPLNWPIKEPLSKEAPVFLVASPVPTVNPQFLEDRLLRVRERLEKMGAERKTSKENHYIFRLPTEIDFSIPYVDLAAYEESYFLDLYPNSRISEEYRKIADAICNYRPSISTSCVDHLETRATTFRDKLNSGTFSQRPLKIALEDACAPYIRYFCRSVLALTEKCVTESGDAKFSVEYKEPVIIEFQSASENDAEWDKFVRKDGGSYSDILQFPEDYVNHLIAAGKSKVDLVNQVFDLSEINKLISGPSPISLRSLDASFPGWREDCSARGRITSLPFSNTTTVLCANRCFLESCQERIVSEGFTTSIPSNWPNLFSFLNSAAKTPGCNHDGFRPYGIATKGRGVFYEWLNIVAALGSTEVPDAVDGEAFENLRKLIDSMGTDTSVEKLGMSDLYRKFADGKIGMFIGWTDAFWFDWSKSGFPMSSRLNKPKCTPFGEDCSNSPNVKLCLAPVPQYVEHGRRHVKHGWLLTYPKQDHNKDRESRLEAALAFTDLLLREETQRDLLRRGFPSASTPLVEEALHLHDRVLLFDDREGKDQEASRQAHLNYGVFLRALRDSVRTGFWMHREPRPQELITEIANALATKLGV